MRHRWFVAASIAIMLSLFPVVAEAAVLRVVVVDVSDAAAYVRQIEVGKALLKKAGSPAQIRVWRARFAGPDAGQYVVSVEYPDLQSFAADDKRLAADAEYQGWIKGLDSLRTIVSDSLYEETKP
jgi:hypothetical protein